MEARIESSESRIDSLEKRVDSLASEPAPSTTENIIAEINDRAKRAFNAMIFNIPESSSSSIDTRKRHDISNVKNLLNLFQIDTSSVEIKCIRVGKSARNKVRPVKAIFNDSEIVRKFCTSFSRDAVKNAYPELSSVAVTRDRTSEERNHLKKLRDELKKRVDSGETNLTIKYNNGVPTITVVSSKND
ncbi:MAG: hypothetical protein KFE21_00015 [Candidatus Sulcia muelleri]|nr:hypothetical protein [Candidatus Karelsulcia muelleri]